MRAATRLARTSSRRLSNRPVVDARATAKTNVPLLAAGAAAGAWLACLELPVQLGAACPDVVRDAWWLKLYREATGRALPRTVTPAAALVSPDANDDIGAPAEFEDEFDDDEVLDPGLERERLDALADAQAAAELVKAQAEQDKLDEEAVKVVARASEIIEVIQAVPEDRSVDELLTRLARDLQDLSISELEARCKAAEHDNEAEARREAARAATARSEAARVYEARTEELVEVQRRRALEEMGQLVAADDVLTESGANTRRSGLRVEKEAVLSTQRTEIEERWARDGAQQVDAAVKAVEGGAAALVDAARADAAQATADAAVARLTELRELEVRIAAAHLAADAVPVDDDARTLLDHAVVARGAAGSRAVGCVADDHVVKTALRARNDAPGGVAGVAALRARWLESVRPAAQAAALGVGSGPVARSALGRAFSALRLPGGRAEPNSPLARVEACDAALERGDVIGAVTALEGLGGDLGLAVRDWRRDAAASAVAAQTDRVLHARSSLVAAQRVE